METWHVLIISLITPTVGAAWVAYTFFIGRSDKRRQAAEESATGIKIAALSSDTQFRADLLKRIEYLETALTQSREKESSWNEQKAQLQIENERFKRQVEELREEMRDFKVGYKRVILEVQEKNHVIEKLQREVETLKAILKRHDILETN